MSSRLPPTYIHRTETTSLCSALREPGCIAGPSPLRTTRASMESAENSVASSPSSGFASHTRSGGTYTSLSPLSICTPATSSLPSFLSSHVASNAVPPRSQPAQHPLSSSSPLPTPASYGLIATAVKPPPRRSHAAPSTSPLTRPAASSAAARYSLL